MSSLRGAAGLGAAAVLALTSGCGMLGLGAEEEQSDEERLVAMFNESNRLTYDLQAAEYRIIQNCLEDQGFTVHDLWSLQAYEQPEEDSLVWGYPHETFILDPEEAAEYGFGGWANSPEGWEDPASEDYYAAQEEKYEDEGWEDPDNSEFEALSPEEQYDWNVAYQGEEYVEEYMGTREEWTNGFEEGFEEGEETAEVDESGEIDLGEEDWVDPKPGGCQLEMIEALYGEPELVEQTWEDEGGGSETYSFWSYRPMNPLESEDSTMWEDIEFAYTEAMADLMYEYTDCLAAAGYEGWEFDEYNGLPIWEFFYALYYQDASEEEREMMMGDSSVEIPEIPEDSGDTYEERKAYEIQAAIDFGECGEETDYVAASEKAYDQAHIEAYAAVEEDIYAWQEQMTDAIAKAQDLLDA